MKHFSLVFIIAFLFTILLASCGTTVYQLKSDCDEISTKDLFSSITSLLIDEDFIIKENNLELGYLLAETMPDYNFWTGMTEIRVWTFQHINGKIKASAKVVYTQKNTFGTTTGGSVVYYNDDAHEDWTWYWNIRRGLERLCKNKIIIEKSKKH